MDIFVENCKLFIFHLYLTTPLTANLISLLTLRENWNDEPIPSGKSLMIRYIVYQCD